MGEPREEEGSLEDSLQDSVVREALEGGLDLRDYSKLVTSYHSNPFLPGLVQAN